MTQQVKSSILRDFSDRFELALRTRSLSKADVARQINVSAPTVSRWKGKHIPSPSVMESLCKVLGVRKEWLIAGTEPMEPTSQIQGEPWPPGFDYEQAVKDGEEYLAKQDMAMKDLDTFPMTSLIALARAVSQAPDKDTLLQWIFRAMERQTPQPPKLTK